jgi:radical SAM superfamily enzyme YgiQ (UPF0313 family)
MKKYTVVLYNPAAVFFTMPLALIAIGSYLDSSKYDVVIIDGRLEADPMIKIRSALGKNPVCFATTVLTGRPIRDALDISRKVKEEFPSVPVVWGGWHPSLFPAQTLAEPAIDFVVRGQGEVAFAELLERLSFGKSMEGLNGVCYREGGQIIENPERLMIDIERFPKMDYDLIDVPAYMKLSGRRQLDYISSQGCRFRCAFCADPFMYKRRWAGYSPQRMVDEIEELWHKYKFEHVHFQDETFFTYAPRVKEFAEILIERKLPISWFGTIRADQGVRLSDEIWLLCKKAGLERVMIGMEAGTQEMLDWMQKDIKIEQVFEVAEKCVEFDLGINFSVIVGFPGEPVNSVKATLQMVKKLRKMSSAFHMGIFYYKPYPGNIIADRLLKDGYKFASTLEEWSQFDYVASGKSEFMSEETVAMVENFKFYQNIAYNKPTPLKKVLQGVARWRIDREEYRFPIERRLKEWLRPQQQMS